jgi:hypothetical protein
MTGVAPFRREPPLAGASEGAIRRPKSMLRTTFRRRAACNRAGDLQGRSRRPILSQRLRRCGRIADGPSTRMNHRLP